MDYKSMTDERLNTLIVDIYSSEADRFDTTVQKLFNMSALRDWFRADFPGEIEGLSAGMIKFAKISLIEKGLA